MENNSKQIAKPPPKITGNEEVDEEDKIALKKITRVAEDIALMDQGTVRIREDSSTRKDKPPTLNPEAMRSLLENRFQMILSKEANDPNFLKCLLVSRRFLNTARRYPIFCLSIDYRAENVYFGFTNLPIFKLPLMIEDSKGSKEIFLSYEKVDSLLSMLKPKQFLIGFENSDVSNETITKAIGHLDHACGKVALVLLVDVQAEFSLLLDQFSRRKLEFLLCSPDVLTRLDVTLKIGHYLSTHPVNNRQLRKVLSHSVDFLTCEIDGHFMDKPAPPKSSSLNHCTSLKWLHVVCDQHYDSLMAFLDVVKDRCPSLQTIDVVIALGDGEILHVSNADEILDQILIAQGKIQQIIEKCRPLVQHLKISSYVLIWYGSAEEFPSDEWIGRAKSLDCFKEATYEEMFSQGRYSRTIICQFHSKFNDGFLELGHTINVDRPFQQ